MHSKKHSKADTRFRCGKWDFNNKISENANTLMNVPATELKKWSTFKAKNC